MPPRPAHVLTTLPSCSPAKASRRPVLCPSRSGLLCVYPGSRTAVPPSSLLVKISAFPLQTAWCTIAHIHSTETHSLHITFPSFPRSRHIASPLCMCVCKAPAHPPSFLFFRFHASGWSEGPRNVLMKHALIPSCADRLCSLCLFYRLLRSRPLTGEALLFPPIFPPSFYFSKI